MNTRWWGGHGQQRRPGLRLLLSLCCMVILGRSLLAAPLPLQAASEVRVAIIVPLSGRWARQGALLKAGAEMAVEDINAQGGITALGGAKMRLLPADAGDSVQKATSAAQRVLAAGNISAAQGAWLSAFTLGATEVAERLGIPWLTLSWADKMTARGFPYVFQSSPVASHLAELALEQVMALAQEHGVTVTRVALVGDSTAAMVNYFQALRGTILPRLGISSVVDAVYTPPLLDATTIVQQVRATRPDVLISGTTAHADAVTLLHKLREWQVHVPLIGVGAQFTTREFRDGVGPELVAGLMATVASHTMAGQEDLVQRFHKRTKEAWMMQDAISAYAEIWIIKEAMEKAASAHPTKVREALAALDIQAGPAARVLLPGRIRFDAQGRRLHAVPVLVQWQEGVPYTVYPPEGATRQAVWPQ